MALKREDRLTVEWLDPRGKTWNLTDGTEGVILDVDQSDLTLPGADHYYTPDGKQWTGVKLHRAEPSLKVIVGDGLTSEQYYQLADEWWSVANSYFSEGTLRFTRPNGAYRELRARLRDTPGTTYRYDPGADIDDAPGEPWLLTAATSYYEGPLQAYVFDNEALSADRGTPFYGPNGAGWPLYIADAKSADNVYIRNNGQGSAWITWVLKGPLTNPTFGTSLGVLSIDGNVALGEQIVVTTAPGDRFAYEVNSGQSRYSSLTGTFAPLPVGDRVPLTIKAEGMTPESSITMSVREQFVRPF